jgi:hypothetical protein
MCTHRVLGFVKTSQFAFFGANTPSLIPKSLVRWNGTSDGCVVPEGFCSVIANNIQKSPNVKGFSLMSWWLSVQIKGPRDGDFFVVGSCSACQN